MLIIIHFKCYTHFKVKYLRRKIIIKILSSNKTINYYIKREFKVFHAILEYYECIAITILFISQNIIYEYNMY